MTPLRMEHPTTSPLHKLTRGQWRILRVLQQEEWQYEAAAERLQMSVESIRTAVSRSMDRTKIKDSRQLAYLLGREDAAQRR